jgi:hypothetical protein
VIFPHTPQCGADFGDAVFFQQTDNKLMTGRVYSGTIVFGSFPPVTGALTVPSAAIMMALIAVFIPS